MTNDPVLITYTVKDRPRAKKALWQRIGVAFPHDKGSGLTVLLDALPSDGRVVLMEPKADFPQAGDFARRPGRAPRPFAAIERQTCTFRAANPEHDDAHVYPTFVGTGRTIRKLAASPAVGARASAPSVIAPAVVSAMSDCRTGVVFDCRAAGRPAAGSACV